MENIIVTIPTNKAVGGFINFFIGIIQHMSYPHMVYATCINQSAAKNRNSALCYALSQVSEDCDNYIIMVDDDAEGFYRGWADELVSPLKVDPLIKIVSARLVNSDGSMASMMHANTDTVTDVVYSEYVPSSCIAFRLSDIIDSGLSFHEGFVGSGFEDTYFCDQIKDYYPSARFAINNRCKIIHKNHMQNQQGEYYFKNHKLYNHLTKAKNVNKRN